MNNKGRIGVPGREVAGSKNKRIIEEINNRLGSLDSETLSVLTDAAAMAHDAEVAKEGAVYDVTARNNGTTFASLDALLSDANLSNLIPTGIRKGGMSIRFVQSSDNKYVQFRCMSNEFTTDISAWQGVDNEPTAGSDNLVKSGGVLREIYKNAISWKNIKEFHGSIGVGTIDISSTNMYKLIPVENGDIINITFPPYAVWYAIISKAPSDVDNTYSLANGCSRKGADPNQTSSISVSAEDAKYLLLQTHVTVDGNSVEAYPKFLAVNKQSYLPGLNNNYGTIVPAFNGIINITDSQITIPSGSRMIVGGKYINIDSNTTISYDNTSQSTIVIYNIFTNTFTAVPLSAYVYAKGDYILFSVGYGDRLCSLPFSYYRFKNKSPLKSDVLSIVDESSLYTLYSSFGWTKGYYIKNDGALGTSNDWAVTRKIPCAEGDVIRWKSGAVSSSYTISIVVFNATGQVLNYISVGNMSERTLTCVEGSSYLIASFYTTSASGYLYINNNQVISLNQSLVSQLPVNNILEELVTKKSSKLASITSTGTTKINITDTTIKIPGFLRIVYGRGGIYRLPNGGVELQRVAPTGSSVQSEYVLFDSSDNSIKTIEEQSLNDSIVSSDTYILFSVSNGLSGCSLSYSQYNVNGQPPIEGNKYVETDIIIQNKHKESAVVNTSLYKGNSIVKANDKLSILHLTDIHGDTTNIARMLKYYNKYTNLLDFVIHTGDSVSNVITDDNPFEEVTGGSSVLNVAGNHEAWLQTSDNDYYATEKQVYDKIFANCISNWNVVQPQDAAIDGKCYYYKDVRNFRLIVLDSVHWHTGGNAQITDDASVQKAWFQSVLADAITNSKKVICAIHYPPVNGLDIVKNLGGFNTLDAQSAQNPVIVGDGWYSQDEIFDCVDTFITNGGDFICWIAGHTHNDYFGLVHGHLTQQFVILGTSGTTVQSKDNKNVVGANTQDNFNIITLSYISATQVLIKIVRIGNDYDMYNRSRNTLCYNVVDGTIVSVN